MSIASQPMKKLRIEPKRDFGDGPGFWMPGAGNVGSGNYGFVKSGFIVTDGVCNIMPGATWFRTIADACDAIKVLHEVGGDAKAFWRLWRERKTKVAT